MNGYYLYPSKLKDCYQDELEQLRKAYSVKREGQYIYYRNINGRNLGKKTAMAIWYHFHGREVAPRPKDIPVKRTYKPLKPTKRGIRLLARAWDMRWPILVVWLVMIGAMFFFPERTNEFVGWNTQPNISPVRFTEEELKAFYEKHGVKKAEAKVLGASTVNVEELIRKHFGKDADKAIKCFKSESGLRPTAFNGKNRNGTWDAGISQINQIHCPKLGLKGDACKQALFDPETNLALAKKIFDGRGWVAWYGKGCK